MAARTFAGYRPAPPEEYAERGIANGGEAPDYEGALFSDGTVAVRWLTAYRSHSVWGSWKSFYEVHGHPEYGTVIEWDDGGDEEGPPAPAGEWRVPEIPCDLAAPHAEHAYSVLRTAYRCRGRAVGG